MKLLKVVGLFLILALIFPLDLLVSTVDNWEEIMDDIDRLEKCTSCPHPRFIERHICPYCDTLQEAATFTRLIRGTSIRKNTVIFGTPNFELKSYLKKRCGNIDAVPAAVCQKTEPGVFECEFIGQRCFCEHSTSNGHLYFHEIKCE